MARPKLTGLGSALVAVALALAGCNVGEDTAAVPESAEGQTGTDVVSATAAEQTADSVDTQPLVEQQSPSAKDQASQAQAPGTRATDEARPQQAEPAGTFTATAERTTGDIWENRMPAEAGRSILVPATTLFPGAARVDPEITNPYSGNAQAIAAGERHFAAFNCAGCHAPLAGGGMGPPLSDDDWIYGGEPAQIFMSIMHGRGNGMPAWASMLPAKTVWEMVAYIETLSDIEDYASELGFEDRGGRHPQSPSPVNSESAE